MLNRLRTAVLNMVSDIVFWVAPVKAAVLESIPVTEVAIGGLDQHSL